jgi:chaperonin GroES
MNRKLSLDKIVGAANLIKVMDEDDVKEIGSAALDGYHDDLTSRREWEDRQAQSNRLALQVYEEKTTPWPGAASVKFPLITVAALQYHAKAYPSLVDGNDLVKCRVFGDDPDGMKSLRAKRVSTHMSWQCLEQDEAWEEEHDKLFLVQAIAGSAFIKTVYEPGPGKIISMLVLPKNFVVNYWTKHLADSPRYTHTFYLNSNNIKQRELDGRFVEVKAEPARAEADEISEAMNERQGTTEPEVEERITPYFTAEQYCWWDLDGDGYEEPYIVTFDIASGAVRRIAPRFLPSGIRNLAGERWQKGDKVYKIKPVSVFTKYGFIPSPDGGFYDIGLGSILGPLNESVDTAINQIFDAGTMATLGGGFLGRGFKGKGGPISFQPNMWYPVDAPGDDLRKSIIPLPVREPSAVLFQMIGFLTQYAERIVSATDIQMGENPGQNTPAETTRTLNENGARVYRGIYKRDWRCMREEYRIRYDLNSLFLDKDAQFEDLTSGKGAIVRPDDYLGPSTDIRPAADPHIVSDVQSIEQAKLVFANSLQVPGHNRYQATLRLYRAMRIPNIEEILPPPQQPDPQDPKKMVPAKDFPPMPNPKMMEQQRKDKEFELERIRFQTEQQTTKLEMQMEVAHNTADIMKLYAQAEKLMADAKGVATGHEIALIEMKIAAKKNHLDGLLKGLEIVQKGQKDGNDGGAGVDGVEKSGGDQKAGGAAKGNGAGTPGGMAQPAL